MSLNAQITLSILAHEGGAGGIARSLRVTPAAYQTSLSEGTAAYQAQVVWSDSRTLSGTTESLNLASLADTRDGAAVTTTITAVKAVYVRNSHASAGLTFAGAPFPAGGVTVAAGGAYTQVDPTANGMTASTVTVTGTTGATYDIVLIGEGSVA